MEHGQASEEGLSCKNLEFGRARHWNIRRAINIFIDAEEQFDSLGQAKVHHSQEVTKCQSTHNPKARGWNKRINWPLGRIEAKRYDHGQEFDIIRHRKKQQRWNQERPWVKPPSFIDKTKNKAAFQNWQNGSQCRRKKVEARNLWK